MLTPGGSLALSTVTVNFSSSVSSSWYAYILLDQAVSPAGIVMDVMESWSPASDVLRVVIIGMVRSCDSFSDVHSRLIGWGPCSHALGNPAWRGIGDLDYNSLNNLRQIVGPDGDLHSRGRLILFNRDRGLERAHIRRHIRLEAGFDSDIQVKVFDRISSPVKYVLSYKNSAPSIR